MLLAAAAAPAQVPFFSQPGSTPGRGGGARSVVRAGGRVYVFFSDGADVRYTSTADGVAFCNPQSATASGAGGDLGFSVAAFGDKLGLVQGHFDGSLYSLVYSEAQAPSLPPACPTLSFVSVYVDSSPSLRGGSPAVAFSSAGLPALVAYEQGQPYHGALTGCGGGKAYRPSPHYFDGTQWHQVGYCNNFSSIESPASPSMAALSNGRFVYACTLPNSNTLNSGVLDPALALPAAELGEPWKVVGNASGGLSSVGSATAPSEVHHVYSASGSIAYARQDATLLGLGDLAVQTATLGAASSIPALSRPTDPAGCYTVAWTSGNEIHARRFQGDVARIGGEAVVFTRPSPPAELGLELESSGPPAMTWREGGTLLFATLPAPAAPTLVPSAPAAPADGVSTLSFTAGTFTDACDGPVPDGTPVTVTASLGTVVEADADAAKAGTQLPSAVGAVQFTLRAPSVPGTAAVEAATPGKTPVTAQVTFYAIDASTPAGPDAAGAGPDAASLGPDAGWAPDAGSPSGDAADDAGVSPDASAPVLPDAGAADAAPTPVADASLDPADAQSRLEPIHVELGIGCGVGGQTPGWSALPFAAAWLALGLRRRQ